MSYTYTELRPSLFTEKGQVVFLAIRDTTNHLLRFSGAARMQEILRDVPVTSDNWTEMAAVDRMIELKEIREITGPNVMGQHRVFVKIETEY